MTSTPHSMDSLNQSITPDPYIPKEQNQVLDAKDWNEMQQRVRIDINQAMVVIAGLNDQIEAIKTELAALRATGMQMAADLENHDHSQESGQKGKPIRTESMTEGSIDGKIIKSTSSIFVGKLMLGEVDAAEKLVKIDTRLDWACRDIRNNSGRLDSMRNCRIQLKSWKDDYLHRPDNIPFQGDSRERVTTWSSGVVGSQWTIEFLEN